MDNHRSLFVSVILQACQDIEREPIGSTNYVQAVTFFTAAEGEWLESRQAIADMLDLHPDDLMRAGVRAIRARRKAEGLPEAEAPRPAAVVRAPKPERIKPAVVVATPFAVPVRARKHEHRVTWVFDQRTGFWCHAPAKAA